MVHTRELGAQLNTTWASGGLRSTVGAIRRICLATWSWHAPLLQMEVASWLLASGLCFNDPL
jgi:hypothetical protein